MNRNALNIDAVSTEATVRSLQRELETERQRRLFAESECRDLKDALDRDVQVTRLSFDSHLHFGFASNPKKKIHPKTIILVFHMFLFFCYYRFFKKKTTFFLENIAFFLLLIQV